MLLRLRIKRLLMLLYQATPESVVEFGKYADIKIEISRLCNSKVFVTPIYLMSRIANTISVQLSYQKIQKYTYISVYMKYNGYEL